MEYVYCDSSSIKKCWENQQESGNQNWYEKNKLQRYRDGCKTFNEVADNLYDMANAATLFTLFRHG